MAQTIRQAAVMGTFRERRRFTAQPKGPQVVVSSSHVTAHYSPSSRLSGSQGRQRGAGCWCRSKRGEGVVAGQSFYETEDVLSNRIDAEVKGDGGMGTREASQTRCKETSGGGSSSGQVRQTHAVSESLVVERVLHALKTAALCLASPLLAERLSCRQAVAAGQVSSDGPREARIGRRHHRRRLEEASSEAARKGIQSSAGVGQRMQQGFRASASSTGSARPGAGAAQNGGKAVTVVVDLGGVQKELGSISRRVKQDAGAMAKTVEGAVENVISEARETLADLRASVAVQPGGRLVISVRQDTLFAAGKLLAASLLLLLAGRYMVSVLKRLGWGWAENRSGSKRIVRDRSLGGRLVTISPSSSRSDAFLSSFRRLPAGSYEGSGRGSPLDEVRESTRSEKELARRKAPASDTWRRRQVELPGWWPALVMPPGASPEARESGRREAQAYLEGMLERRLSGADFAERDIGELWRLCERSGARVALLTDNTRDSLYRAAVSAALAACVRGALAGLSISPASAPQFVAGFAAATGVPAERAATMVSAAIAARTRSSFTQAWALIKQGRLQEAQAELRDLAAIHVVFPPETRAPEMEMVAQGLAPRLTLAERKELLSLYLAAGGGATEQTAAYALGLSASNGRPYSPPPLSHS